MTAKMVDSITVDRHSIFKGASRVVQRVSTTVPVKLEDIMAPTTYVLASGWVDIGPTTEDGLTQTRTAELSDGIPVDQRRVALDKGEPDSWEMTAECTLLDTTYAKLVIALEYGTVTALTAIGGRVAQHQVSIDAPQAFTARQFAFIPYLTWCNPDRRQSPVPQQSGQASCIQLVRLVHVAHHHFCFGCMCH